MRTKYGRAIICIASLILLATARIRPDLRCLYFCRGFSAVAVDAAGNVFLSLPEGVAIDSADSMYIADTQNNRVRTIANGNITTVAGTGARGFSGDNGPATSAQLSTPVAVAVDPAGNLNNYRIRKVSAARRGRPACEDSVFRRRSRLPGYNQVNFLLPGRVSPGAAVSLRLGYLDRSSNQVTIAVQ